jgi:hypothetical protein
MLGNPLTDANWAKNVVDLIDRVVGKVRALLTDNAVKASRAIVFGLLAIAVILIATPLAVILLVRFTEVVLSRIFRTDHNTTLWITYYVIGGLFTMIGFVMLRLRHRKELP